MGGARHTLLLGIPVDFTEFSERFGSSDWLAKFRDDGSDTEARELAARRCWDEEYQPLVAAAMGDLIAGAEASGVKVVRKVRLASVAAATADSDAVILFAHWKGYELLIDDFIGEQDPAVFLRRSQSDGSPLGKWLQHHLALLTGAGSAQKSFLGLKWRSPFAERAAATLADVLREAMEADLIDDAPCGIVDQTIEWRFGRLSHRRAQLDQIFNGLIRPGNRIELFDGMHDKETFEAAIAQGFGGWLDLTTCTSSFLADHLLRKRHNAFRIVQFEKVQEFLWHAHCVRIALKLTHDLGLAYPEARLVAHATLKDAVRMAANETGERP